MPPDLSLIAPEPHHAALWHAWRQQEPSKQVNPMLPHSISELRERLANSRPDLSIAEQRQHRWIVKSAWEPIGIVALDDRSNRLRHGEIAYQLNERFHRRGLGRRALALLVDKIFAETDLHRLFGTVAAPNAASVRLIEAVGFRREGCLRDHFLIDGEYMDVFFYGLLRGEQLPVDRDQ